MTAPVTPRASEPRAPARAGKRRRAKPAAALALMRVPHWTKNAFVLAPLIFAKKLDDGAAVVDSIAAFLVFSFAASAVYVINDWADRAEDARHPTKRTRPLASGELRGRDAVAIVALLVAGAAAVGIGAGLQPSFWAVIATYLAMNVAYSTRLRHVDLVDVCIIAAGFVLRVVAGTTAIGVEASQWIILSTGLLALLLALGKRRTDLAMEDVTSRRSLDGYTVEFIDTALAALAASVIGFYSLFTVSDYAQARFGSDNLYVTTFFVAVGVLRYLQLVIGHGRASSPTDIALEDRPLQVIVVGWLATFILIAFVL
jgi:decaprenyl-phosphate phosphoribosyltransferase